MKLELERNIILEKREVSDGSHPWCLKEVGLDETKYSERWVPARGTYCFTASSIALNTSLSNDSTKKAREQSFLDEVIVAKLYPGMLRQGSVHEDYRFSTLGTNHTIEVFQFYLKPHNGEETDNKCFIRDVGISDQKDFNAINFEIHLSLAKHRFDIFREMITAKAADTFELILIGVSGFYKDEFSIGEARKLLTHDLRKMIKTEGANNGNGNKNFNPEDVGKVREWDISLEHQLKLDKFKIFSKTDLSGNPPIDASYIERSVKPYLKNLHESEDQQQARSDLHSIIVNTANNIADYSNSINESRQNYKKRLDDAIKILDKREKEILESRRLSEDPKTLEELSQKYKISRERIRQIENKAFEKLQKHMLNSAKSKNLLPAN